MLQKSCLSKINVMLILDLTFARAAKNQGDNILTIPHFSKWTMTDVGMQNKHLFSNFEAFPK